MKSTNQAQRLRLKAKALSALPKKNLLHASAKLQQKNRIGACMVYTTLLWLSVVLIPIKKFELQLADMPGYVPAV